MKTVSPAIITLLSAIVLAVVILASGVLGMVALILPGVFAIALLLPLFTGHRADAIRGIAALLSIWGALIGVISAAYAIATASGEPGYDDRVFLGWLALALALGALLAALQLRMRPLLASAGIFLCSTLGFIAISLFYINTFYFLSTLLFWCAAIVALGLRGRADAGQPG